VPTLEDLDYPDFKIGHGNKTTRAFALAKTNKIVILRGPVGGDSAGTLSFEKQSKVENGHEGNARRW
jgi:hypothetical protein